MRAKFTLQDALIVQREKFLAEQGNRVTAGALEAFADATNRFPATMSSAAGLFAFRIGQRNPNFVL
jgi:hypothetical protein